MGSGASRGTGATAPSPRLPPNWPPSPGTEGSRAETGMCGAEAGLVCCLGGADTPQVSFGVPLGSDCLAQGQGLGVLWLGTWQEPWGPRPPSPQRDGTGSSRPSTPPFTPSSGACGLMPERREGDGHTSRRPLCSPRHGWSPGSGWGATHGQGRTTGGGGSRRGRGRGSRTCSFHTREKPHRAQRPLPVSAAPAPLRAGEGVWPGPCVSALLCLPLSRGMGWGTHGPRTALPTQRGTQLGTGCGGMTRPPRRPLGRGPGWDTSSPPLGVCSPILGERGKG